MDKNVLSDYLANLNPDQFRAATLGNQSAVILAAAGSGKTSTLTCRIANLVGAMDVKPHNILAVTFTNKAAKEMIHRLSKMGLDTKNLWVGTFHGICNKILRAHAKEAGLQKSFTIMDSNEQESFFKRMLRANSYDPKNLNVSDLLNKINGYKEVGWRSDQLKMNSQERTIYALYEKACITDNVVDFGELLLGCCELFKNHPHLAESYAEKFEHILVDEFQDTNELQYKWLKILASKHGNLFAVGDDDQSIYAFRGAKPENLTLLKRDFNAEMIKIEKNYHSDANILEAANAVIANNTNRLGKNLVATREKGNYILSYEALNDAEESAFIADEIKRLRRANVPYRNMAILYRTNGQSRSLEKSLNAMNIPYIIYGGFRFFDRQEVKHAMAFLRLANNPNDNMAFLRVVNIPARAIGPTAVQKLEIFAQENNVSLFQAAQMCDDKNQKKFMPFIELVDHLQRICSKKTLPEMVKNVIVESGLEALYESDKKEGPERLDNLYELISAAEVFIQENKQADIEEFLAFSSLESDFNSKKRDDTADVVKLMTVHASKGLEFEAVFISGLEEGLFPHTNSIGEPAMVEEERRLMYVAITRAKKQLYLTRCEERMLHGQRNGMVKSRFFREIPTKLIQRVK
jgi:DNA helicase-2/ATP-dependent DNA helicase PcrA